MHEKAIDKKCFRLNLIHFTVKKNEQKAATNIVFIFFDIFLRFIPKTLFLCILTWIFYPFRLNKNRSIFGGKFSARDSFVWKDIFKAKANTILMLADSIVKSLCFILHRLMLFHGVLKYKNTWPYKLVFYAVSKETSNPFVHYENCIASMRVNRIEELPLRSEISIRSESNQAFSNKALTWFQPKAKAIPRKSLAKSQSLRS